MMVEEEKKTQSKIPTNKWGSWDESLVELKDFHKKNGHANPSEGKLAEWLKHQRYLFAKGGHSHMQVAILRGLGCQGFDAKPKTQEKKTNTEESCYSKVGQPQANPAAKGKDMPSKSLGEGTRSTPTDKAQKISAGSDSKGEIRNSITSDGRKETGGARIGLKSPEAPKGQINEGKAAVFLNVTPDKADAVAETRDAFPQSKLTSSLQTNDKTNEKSDAMPDHIPSVMDVMTTPASSITRRVSANEMEITKANRDNSNVNEKLNKEFRPQQGCEKDNKEPKVVPQLNDNDVVCWGGGSSGYDIVIKYLPGNVQFRDIVKTSSNYASDEPSENLPIAETILTQVCEMTPPGRFVKTGADGAWVEVGNQEATNFVLKVLHREAGICDDMFDVEEEEAMPNDIFYYPAMPNQSFAEVSFPSNDFDFDMAFNGLAPNDYQRSSNRPTRNDQQWEHRFQLLVDFKNRYGHANPTKSRKLPEEDMKTGGWLWDQRRKYKLGKLPPEKAQRLTNLGCTGFDDASSPDAAERKPVHVLMADYEEARHVHRHTKVSNSASREPETSYEDDMARQRAAFFWLDQQTISGSRSNTWKANFLALKEFKEERGHASPSEESDDENEELLAEWLDKQQELFERDRLCPEQITLLQYLGCEGFEEDETATTQSESAEFVTPDKVDFKLGGLSVAERGTEAETSRAEIGSFGTDYENQRRLTWPERFSQLVEFKRRHGHPNPVRSKELTDEENRLRRWLADQRKLCENQRLAADRVQKLKDLGCTGFEHHSGGIEYTSTSGIAKADKQAKANISKAARNAWEARYLQLVHFKHVHGHAQPRRAKESSDMEYSLGSWLTSQRMKFRSHMLDEEQVLKLQSLGCTGFGGETEKNESEPEEYGKKEAKKMQHGNSTWECRFLDLLDFKNRNGHANPRRSRDATDSDYKLGSWLSTQRVKYREGTLSEDQIHRLQDIGCIGFGEEDMSVKRHESTQRLTWEQHYSNLVEFKRYYGHANPRRSKGDSLELGNWLATQRHRFKKGRLSMEKSEMLRELGSSGFGDDDEEEQQEESEVCYFIEQPNENDVVCGRGGHVNSWPGNIKFRQLVNSKKEMYGHQLRNDKLRVAKDVVRAIRNSSPPGRFLSKCPNGFWVEVSEERAVRKTSQALREHYRDNGVDEDMEDTTRSSDDESENENASSNAEDDDEESEESGSGSVESEDESSVHQRSEDDSNNSDEESDDNNNVSEEESESEENKIDKNGQVVETGCVPWSTRYLQLKHFRKRNGHANPGCAKGPDYHIGHWLSDQRYKYRKGTLPPEKIEQLRALGCDGFGDDAKVVKNSKGRRGSGASVAKPEPPRPSKPKNRPNRRRRLGIGSGVASPPRAGDTSGSTRSGRPTKRMKSSGGEEYLFY